MSPALSPSRRADRAAGGCQACSSLPTEGSEHTASSLKTKPESGSFQPCVATLKFLATGPKPLKLNPGPASLPVQTRRGRAASISWPAHWAGDPRDGSRPRASRGEPGPVFPQCPDPSCGHGTPLLPPSKGTGPKVVPRHRHLGSNELLNPISFLFHWSSRSKSCPKNIAGEHVRDRAKLGN